MLVCLQAGKRDKKYKKYRDYIMPRIISYFYG
jgi:hypothetical protein